MNLIQLARTNSEKKYFLSDDVIAASYGGTPPSSFAEITSMDHVVLSGESGNSGFSAKEVRFYWRLELPVLGMVRS